MTIRSAIAVLALVSLVPSMPATAAKDEKLARCNGKKKRPANPYGTVLPTVPGRSAAATTSRTVPHGTPDGQATPDASTPPATNLFRADVQSTAPQTTDTSHAEKVPAIGAVTTSSSASAALLPRFASC